MTPDFKLPLTGRCQCKSVTYRSLRRRLPSMRAIARNASGSRAAPSAFPCLPTEAQLLVEGGQPAVWERQHESGRVIDCVICAKCGSRLFHEPRANTKITIVKAGNLDDTSWLFPVGHIWTRSAQPWVAIPPDGANCDVQPPNFGNIIEAWRRHCGAG